MAFHIKSVLDPGTRSGENTRNNGFIMISDWFFYFGVYLDRENRYNCLKAVRKPANFEKTCETTALELTWRVLIGDLD